ncbi:hypothetical protein [Microbacterium sp. YJN-G]|uniref:hypothetical protein n=1 Tax=Microbacterium sp. YJN-G TaxID=2763257 RepID=UPI001877F45F|nr:hypothetical protein [Microbacterium sp. YJN-G]
MNLRRSAAAGLIAVALAVTGCSAAATPEASSSSAGESPAAAEPTPEQLDLTGEWSWHEAPDPEQTLTATITTDRIEIFWPSFEVGEEGDAFSGTMDSALYWAGSFTPPEPGEDTYTFISVGDTEAMQKSLLASSETEKEFSFANGGISFDLTIQGATKTLTLTRD